MGLNRFEEDMRIVLQNFQHVRDDVSLLPDVGEGEKSDVGAKVRYKRRCNCLEGLEAGIRQLVHRFEYGRQLGDA